ncbi:alpha amylase C-terminal domain-containing protein [Aliikangiella sp. G2MR2-5]|uniref:alpha amylase C-terminal domain-containing protein n=1 Tax=Aliikangiella sp. G2MR2-5 TaxID=2788943 RepID=UPI0018ABAEEF|nr:alpha amylase C-terminal domain-containing protein [Aliikangiella sp. G2MR2-5]
MKNYKIFYSAAFCFLLMLLSKSTQAGTAFVHLFEWRWTDIANECETFLGPKGFDAVQISPPNEHINHSTWWARYQPVSYQLNSRSGSEAELQDMIQRCHAVGVKIYADLVINHTAAWNSGGTGTAGTLWSLENHPALYSSNDYHSPRYNISSYSDANHVWNGKLSGLPDLNTGSSYVQDQIAGYINHLKSIGVDGFRVDAAKHMAPLDIQAILDKAGNPWSFLEVIGAAGEAAEIQPDQYIHVGQVTEFKYGTDIAGNFNGQIKNLKTLGESWGLLPSAKALIFVDNHDRERGHGGGGTLSYKDGEKYNLANIFMLAFPYGYPKVMSGYKFTDTDVGPPVGETNCSNSQWVCQHRWSNIANMVGFRNYTVDSWSVNNWWDNGNNQIAFGRGDKGFVVINNEAGALTQSLFTGLPEGNYCNVLAGDDACSGEVISVDASGYAYFNVAGMSATAIHGGAMVDDNCTDCGGCTDCSEYQKNFNQLYFRGTANRWSTTQMSLVADNTWEVTINFDGQSKQRFKFDVNGDWSYNFGDNNNDGILEQTGSDIYTSVTGQYKVTVNDETKAYSLTQIGCGTDFNKNFDSLYFRGTPNGWGTTEMTLVADNTWEVVVNFDGQSNQRYKVDVYGDWSYNFGDNNSDGILEQIGADIYTNVTGIYLLRVNDSTRTYQLIAQ